MKFNKTFTAVIKLLICALPRIKQHGLVILAIGLSSCGDGYGTKANDPFDDSLLITNKDYTVLEYGYDGVSEQIDGYNVITTSEHSLIEGDIEFPINSPISFCDDKKCQTLFGLDVKRYAGSLWHKGIVPFTLSDTLPAAQRTAFSEATDLISSVSNITFVQRTSENDFVEIILFEKRPFQGTSALGKQGDRQLIRVGSQTGYGLALHEILHTLGLSHEQSRPDRDEYLNVLERNIRTDLLSNYRKATETKAVGAYDPLSIMHYANGAFSSCADGSIPSPICTLPQPEICPDGVSYSGINGRCPTMEPLEPPKGQEVTCSQSALGIECTEGVRFVSGGLGQLIGLTNEDINKINALYPDESLFYK